MISEKQIEANRANSQKSTGAKTLEGKLAISGNAINHGLLSNKLVLKGESQEEYHLLLNELLDSLAPVGALEKILIEKIATAIWKHKRLIAAENSSIELDRRLVQSKDINLISAAMVMRILHELSPEDLAYAPDSEMAEKLEENQTILDEIAELDDSILDNNDLESLKANSPKTYSQFKDEAEAGNMEASFYAQQLNLREWAMELMDWCEKERTRLTRKREVQQIAELVRCQASAPINNDLLVRYQLTLDNELYRAIEALRKQQEWRNKSNIYNIA